jgi:hypothetical protein
MEDEVVTLKAILQRMNIIIALQLEALPQSSSSSIGQRIRKLAELGLTPGEIGSIVGKKANYVSAVVGSKRKSQRE